MLCDRALLQPALPRNEEERFRQKFYHIRMLLCMRMTWHGGPRTHSASSKLWCIRMQLPPHAPTLLARTGVNVVCHIDQVAHDHKLDIDAGGFSTRFAAGSLMVEDS
jgi:hypothetical protein